jgi:hypothetical protein
MTSRSLNAANPRRKSLFQKVLTNFISPGGFDISAFAWARAWGIARVKLPSKSGSIVPMVLARRRRFRIARIDSGLFVESTICSRILSPEFRTPAPFQTRRGHVVIAALETRQAPLRHILPEHSVVVNRVPLLGCAMATPKESAEPLFLLLLLFVKKFPFAPLFL